MTARSLLNLVYHTVGAEGRRLHLLGGLDRTGHPELAKKLFHFICITFGTKLWDTRVNLSSSVADLQDSVRI